MCSRRHVGGRVRSTTPSEDRYIVLSAKRNRAHHSSAGANQFLAASGGKQISRKTVARRLRGTIRTQTCCLCPIVQTAPRTARLQRGVVSITIGFYRTGRVLFSDEEVGSVYRIVEANLS
ncbi:hypothetical protein TNCV_1212201 [Trichonephila clavipes]|nr:hypothetical protein TNCV_1212201 [Trichonephila clavipes]